MDLAGLLAGCSLRCVSFVERKLIVEAISCILWRHCHCCHKFLTVHLMGLDIAEPELQTSATCVTSILLEFVLKLILCSCIT